MKQATENPRFIEFNGALATKTNAEGLCFMLILFFMMQHVAISQFLWDSYRL
jgi:hypothetical protein